MYVCMYVCMYVRMYVRTYVRMYVCMYVCMYVSVTILAQVVLAEALQINFVAYVQLARHAGLHSMVRSTYASSHRCHHLEAKLIDGFAQQLGVAPH